MSLGGLYKITSSLWAVNNHVVTKNVKKAFQHVTPLKKKELHNSKD